MDMTAKIQAAGGSAVAGPDGATLAVASLRDLVDRMQLARRGSVELDRQVDAALRQPSGTPVERPFERPVAQRWSCDLDHAMALLPQSYNYSLGRRDGVCWAWTQPNDRWEPNEYEARHDHPGGSGLVVAHTSALAVACAAVILRIRRIEAAAE